MRGIVTKPSFDAGVFQIGDALFIKNISQTGMIPRLGLINRVELFEIEIVWVNGSGEVENASFSSEDIAGGKYQIRHITRNEALPDEMPEVEEKTEEEVAAEEIDPNEGW